MQKYHHEQQSQAPAEVFEPVLLDGDGNQTTMNELSGNSPRVDLRFWIVDSGEIYILSKANGEIWRLTPPD